MYVIYNSAPTICFIGTSTGPDSIVVRASALGAVSRRFESQPAIPKVIKMVMATPLLMLTTKGSVRKIQEDMQVFVKDICLFFVVFLCVF